MNFIQQIINEAKDNDVVLYVNNDQLAFIARQDRFPKELKAKISKHKREIITLLSTQESSLRTDMAPFALLTEEERMTLGGDYEDAYPMSALQAGMVFHTQLEQFNGVYHDIMAEHVKCPWDRACFEQALAACIHENPILRTGFKLGGGRPLQVVHRTIELPLEVQDLRDLSAQEQEQHIKEWTEAYKRTVFNWETGPLFHIHIFRRTDESFHYVLSFHHTVLDGWSRATLNTLLYNKYERLLSGREPDPVKVDWTYREFIAQEQRVLDDPGAKAYFAAMLEDAPVVQLPRLKSGAAERSQGIVLIEPVLVMSDSLIGLAKELGVPAQAVLLAGHFKALATMSGQTRVVSCITNNGRPEKAGAELSIGLFLNAVPIYLDLSKGTWRELIEQIAKVAAESLEYRHYPLASIQRDLDWPFSEVLFDYTHFHIYHDLTKSDERELALLGNSGFALTNFDLLIDSSRGTYDNSIMMDLVYNKQAFDEDFIARMVQYYSNAYELMLKDVDAPHYQQSLLTEAERKHLVYDLNDTMADYPRQVCLHELFETQVEQNPDAVAVVFGDSQLNYGELNQRANQLANYLVKLGVGPEARVGICMQRSMDLLVALLGVLKASAAYVPLDPAYPFDRLAYMMQDAEIKVLLTQSELKTRLPNYTGRTIELDGEWELIARESSSDLASRAVAENLAYVIYTSGSTGTPKGVAIEHRQVCNQIFWAGDALSLGPTDRVLQKTSYSFDASILELFLPLARGAQIIVAKPGGEHAVDYLVQLAIEKLVTYVDLAPGLLEQIVEYPMVKEWTSLRVMSSGADILRPELVRAFYQSMSGVLWNTYGPTEATVQSTFTVCMESGQNVPIGKPIANTQTYVLDGWLEPVPVGVPGELYIGGAGVTRGYLHHPELTAERFIADGLSGTPGARLYRTGDLARCMPDGNIEYLGRRDFQVKVRGFRIELGEIEHQLAAIEGINAAVVMAREDERGFKQLVAYVTISPEVQPGAGEAELIGQLRKELQSRLPDYMVPARFVILDAFPLTLNGKFDRKALPVPDSAPVFGEYIAPTTPTEIALAYVWGDVLKLDPNSISADANFFDQGGNSLLAMRLMTRVRSTFGVELALRELFLTPTLSGFAQRITDAGQSSIPKLGQADRTQPLPLSFAQQRLWVIDQIDGGSAQYNLPVALRLTGRLNLDALQRALDGIVERHEVLRTTFADAAGTPVQKVHPSGAVNIAHIDLSAMPPSQREAEVRRLAEAEVVRPFDLTHDLMLRVTLIALSDDEHAVLFTQHHIASDGWSVGILVREFSVLYEAYSQERESPLGRLPIQYADYAQWQRDWLQGEVLGRQLDYWKEELAGIAPVHSLPLDKERPPVQDFAGATHWHVLDGELARGLEELCQRENVTLFMLLETVFALLVSRYSYEPDVVIGTPVAGRLHQEVESLIGFFVNNLALRSQFDSNAGFREVLGEQKQRILEAYAHQQVPFEMVVEHLNPERSLGHDPIFQIVFSLNNNEGGELTLPGLRLEPIVHEKVLAKVDLEVVAAERSGQISVSWTYRTGLFSEKRVRELAESYERLLRGVVKEPGLGIYKYAIVNEEQERWLRTKGKGREEAYPRECVHELIERQADKTPHAVAVVCSQQSLSYLQLNQKADRLARYLAEAGVGIGSRVGIHLRRSAEMMIAVLGVMKAGAAYVPLEAGLPSQRVEYMMRDAGVECVLVESGLMEGMRLSGVDVVMMDGAATDPAWLEEMAGEATEAVRRVRADDLAYILYTSGSTGKPKGVMVEHQGLSNYLSHAAKSYLKEGIKGSVVSSPLSFDATLTTLMTPLVAGGSVELLEEDEGLIERLADRMFGTEEGLLFKVTPSHLEALEYVDRSRRESDARHVVVVGGEQLRAELVRRWKGEMLREAVFVNEYGPTEAVVGCSVWELRDDEGMRKLEGMVGAPIGRPIANTQMYVMGEGCQLQPIGSVGELYIGGAGVARGYVKDEEKTREMFIEDPYEEGERVYRTGDLVRWREEGELEYVGRKDAQVKVRGYRIELGEIEHELAKIEMVSGAVVVAREVEGGQKQLVGYVVIEEEAKRRASEAEMVGELRDSLRKVLPDYMVPTRIVVLEQMPLTANGKVDRKALPAPEAGEVERVYVAARDETEEALCEVWQEVLKVDRIGIHDNFFSLGGDSIFAIRVVSMLKSRGVKLDIKDIFQHQTVEQLAMQAGQAAAGEQAEPLEPFALLTEQERSELGDGRYEDAYPMSALQAGMVFHTQMEQFSGIYHDIIAEHVRCAWDRECFERALAACIQEQPLLRTGFLLDRRRPLQVVYRTVELPLEVEDLRGQTQQEQESYLADWIEQRKRHEFDWERGPLLQVNIFLRTDDSFQFVLSFHHSVLDGWSRAVLTTVLYNRYERLLSGQELEAVEENWTYREFIAQEQRVLADGGAKQYFAGMLEEAPGEQLPRLRSKGGQRAQGLIVVEALIGMSERLIGLARELGVPVQSVLMAGHLKVLSVMSGQSRAVTCVTHNGRPETQGAERSLGLYLNSLPQGLEVRRCSWRKLIEAVVEMNGAGMQYRGYPLSRIQQELDWTFSEVLFNYTHFHIYNELTKGGGNELESLGSSGFEQTNFDLLVDVARGMDDALRLSLVYDKQVFDREMIERLGQYYVNAFEQMLEGLDEPHRSLLTEAERNHLLYELNSTKADYPRTVCLHELFEQQVERSPEAVAVVFEGQRLSYRELNEQANQLAHYLRAEGVGPDVVVGLCVERSVEMVVGIIGILKAGGAYLPLDASYPQERLDYMIEDSRPAVVLTQSWLEERLPLVSVPVLRLDTELEELREYSSDNAGLEEVGLRPDHLAYVIYTSGSTGKPKGVMVEHRNVGRLLSVTEADFGFGAQDVWTLFHSYAFDFSVWEMWGALAYGGRLVVVPKWVSRSPEDFYGVLVSEGVTVLNQTPTAFRQLARVDAERQEELALRVVVFGGEALKLSELRGWVERHGEEKPELVNMYGITETTVHVTYRRLRREDVAGERGSVIGEPLGDLRVYVLGEDEELMPEGAVGEMYVGGGGVARGYLNREELTRERFIEDRYEEGERVYRTGDLARWTEEGELEYVGRKDAQVKVRGYRIELGEIEHELAKIEIVSGAVVVAREGEGGQKQLVGYVVIEEEAKRAKSEAEMVGELREGLRRVLPDYMVPTRIVVLEQLPLTPNGKVDRKALPVPEEVEREKYGYVEPRDETEEALCEVWQEVLKVEQVGIHDNFFSLGGDSILAIRVVSMLKSRGVKLDIKDIFQHQTVEQLAMQAGQASADEQAEPLEPFALLTEQERSELGDGRYEDAYPMSALQAGMVFHTQLEQFSGIFHEIMAEHVRCAWDHPCFEQALAACIEEQPILRTGFLLDRRQPLQVVYRTVELPLEVEDLRGQTQQEQESYLSDWIEERKRHEFDWERGPLFQANIFLRTDDSFVFLLSFHHSVMDGWSRATLSTRLYNRYERLLREQELDAVEENWTYREFIAQEQRVLADDGAREYFAAMLEDAPAEQLPRMKATGSERKQGGIIIEPFSALSSQLIELGKQLGVPVQAVLLAIHFKVLSTMSGQTQAVSCVMHNGRPEAAGADWSLGMFLNSLPVSVEVAPCTWRELIERGAEVGTAGMQYRGYPLSRIQQELDWTFSEVLFNYTHFHIYNELARNAEQELEALGGSAFEWTNFDLVVDVARGMDDALRLSLVYDKQVFDREMIERLGQYYVNAFEQMLEGLDEPHRSLLTEAERNHLLYELNSTKADYPRTVCLHELFEQQVERSPEAVAVVFEGQRLSYRELNEQANQLAHYLRAEGVGPDVVVGLCVERSVEMVVGIIGILKAGGAYLPLDASYPQERLDYMIEDSRPAVVLTQSWLEERLPLVSVPVLRLDTELEELREYSSDNAGLEEVGLRPDHLAYVIYTSGSTGKPKGVMVEHRNVGRLLSVTEADFGFGAQDVWTLFHSYAFDFSVWEMWGALAYGGRLVVVPKWVSRSPEDFYGVLVSEGVTVLNQTPTAFRQLARVDAERQEELALRVVVFGGEALKLSELRGWVERHGEEKPELVNMYGITETTVHVTYRRLRREDVAGERGSVIGEPLGDLRVYVLGEDEELMPEGAVGEMYVGGGGVARGYLNREELTRERFIEDRYEEGERVYRTGDLARWTEEGELEYVGRKDAQVKVRGYRIELGEIEHELAKIEIVSGAVVVAREVEGGQKQLVGYVVIEEEAKRAESEAEMVGELREGLRRVLPDYMVPAHFVLLEQMPLTANGKVDRKALPVAEDTFLVGEYVEPNSPTEAALRDIWLSVLALKSLSVTANFFELGGNSILAIHLITLINKHFGNALEVRDVFQLQTLRDMAGYIDANPHLRNRERVISQSNLLELKLGQPPAKPLFLVHPSSGYANCYSELAINLDYQGPVFGLQVNGIVPETIEAMAKKYIEAIKLVQPEGSYLLGGWSMGGVVAYEMARQLNSARENVDLLLMIDSFCPNIGEIDALRPMSDANERVLQSMASELGITGRSLSSSEKDDLDGMGLDELLVLILRLGKEQNRLPSHFSLEELKERYAVAMKNSLALRAYRALPLDCEIQLIRAEANNHVDRFSGVEFGGRESIGGRAEW